MNKSPFKKLIGKIYSVGLIMTGIAIIVFSSSSIYLNFQIRNLIINSTLPPDPFQLIGFYLGFLYYGFLSLLLSIIFGVVYSLTEFFWEFSTKNIITKYSRTYLSIAYILILLYSASQIYTFTIHNNERSIIRNEKAIEYSIKKNILDLSTEQSTEIYSTKLKKYGLPDNSKNIIYENRNGWDQQKTFFWGNEKYSILFRNFREIVIKNLTKNTTIYYTVSEFYPYIDNITFDTFSSYPDNSQENGNYLYLRVNLRTNKYPSLFLALDKNGTIFYEELVNGLRN